MRKSLPFLILIVLYLSMTSTAMAEKYYFYKEVGKKLPKGQRYDYHYVPGVKEKFGEDAAVAISLPNEHSDEHKILTLSFHFGVGSKGEDDNTYWFFMDRFSIRDDKKQIPLLYRIPNVTPQNPRYQQLTTYEVVDGTMRTKFEVPVKVKIEKGIRVGDSVGTQMEFKVDTLLRHLYLDYKFRIRKENGTEEIFEGTIPLELASYNVGWWEKTRW